MHVILAGNPNVGKSTIFNCLTGLKQHTGNWTGKTVENAHGAYKSADFSFSVTDIPGTYSLVPHSFEEEVALDAICFSPCDLVVVVCDATCLERNLYLTLQIMETGVPVFICVNMMDEALKKQMSVNIQKLEEILNVPVFAICAHEKKQITALAQRIYHMRQMNPTPVRYDCETESIISDLSSLIKDKCKDLNPRWVALRLAENNPQSIKKIEKYTNESFLSDAKIKAILTDTQAKYENFGVYASQIVMKTAEQTANACVMSSPTHRKSTDEILDRIITGKLSGAFVMLLVLFGVLWITICGANMISELLYPPLGALENVLYRAFLWMKAPSWLTDTLIFGAYRITAIVISVMLPPMAIFFPLFTIMEDMGLLPRIAYNLDKPFMKCNTCGKQSLTMR